MKTDGPRYDCYQCGMTFLRKCPVKTPVAKQERLVCSDCGIGFGVTINKGNKSVAPAVCWLIRLSNFSSLEGVRKIA